jgi:uncharacterized protein involved in exopolysaccharide biosynthesis
MDEINQQTASVDADEVSIKSIIIKIRSWKSFLLSKWIIVLVATLIGATIGIGYAFLRKPIYKAELSFALQEAKSGGSLSGALGLASQFGLDVGSGGADQFSGDNLLQLMRSRSMVEQTLLTTVNVSGKAQTLAEFYINFNDLRAEFDDEENVIHFLPNADRSRFTIKQDSLLGIFHREIIKTNLIVDKMDKKLSIISLQFKSTNQLFSKLFTEVLAKVVSDFYVQTKTKKEVKNIAILQHQTDSVRSALNRAISGVASSVDAAPNANPFMQTLRVPSQRRQVEVQANTAILSELVKNLEVSKMSLLQETPLIQVIDRPILPLEKDKVGKAKGLIVGGLLGAFLAILFLSFSRLYKSIMS